MAQQQVWAALEVALRVPCLYIIDAIFNSYYDSSQSRLCIGLQILLRLFGKGDKAARGPRRASGSGQPRAAVGHVCACLGTSFLPHRDDFAGWEGGRDDTCLHS